MKIFFFRVLFIHLCSLSIVVSVKIKGLYIYAHKLMKLLLGDWSSNQVILCIFFSLFFSQCDLFNKHFHA